MSQAEEIAHVESALRFTKWYGCRRWKDYLITLDMELGVYFGWTTSE